LQFLNFYFFIVGGDGGSRKQHKLPVPYIGSTAAPERFSKGHGWEGVRADLPEAGERENV